jgi:hypothetical protein
MHFANLRLVGRARLRVNLNLAGAVLDGAGGWAAAGCWLGTGTAWLMLGIRSLLATGSSMPGHKNRLANLLQLLFLRIEPYSCTRLRIR